MQINQLKAVMAGMNKWDPRIKMNEWFNPKAIAYIVLKDNSILYFGIDEVVLFNETEELIYVAHGIRIGNTSEFYLPVDDVNDKDNLDRVKAIIDFENVNQIVMRYKGVYMGGVA